MESCVVIAVVRTIDSYAFCRHLPRWPLSLKGYYLVPGIIADLLDDGVDDGADECKLLRCVVRKYKTVLKFFLV